MFGSRVDGPSELLLVELAGFVKFAVEFELTGIINT
jgi:hypothetical protein